MHTALLKEDRGSDFCVLLKLDLDTVRKEKKKREERRMKIQVHTPVQFVKASTVDGLNCMNVTIFADVYFLDPMRSPCPSCNIDHVPYPFYIWWVLEGTDIGMSYGGLLNLEGRGEITILEDPNRPARS